jgi:hypothetical protein
MKYFRSTWPETIEAATEDIRERQQDLSSTTDRPIPTELTPLQIRYLASVAVAEEAQNYYEPDLVKAVAAVDLKHPRYGNLMVEMGLTIRRVFCFTVVVSVSRQAERKTMSNLDARVEALRRLKPNPKRLKEIQALRDQQARELTPVVSKELLYIPSAGQEFDSISRILLRHFHLISGHGSENATLHALRQEFWIPRARKLLKGVRRKCEECCRLNAQFLRAPEAPLPADRLSAERAFRTVGIDFTGPFELIPGDNKRPSIIMFVCAVYRVVNLKATRGQDTETFISAYDHFQSERDVEPEVIYSDNAQAFKQARRLATKYPEVLWKFNASRAPWWGGFYERLMRVLKCFIARTFGNFTFESWQQLATAVSYLEFLINSRPLTAFSDSPGAEVVTPNQLVNPQSKDNFSTRVLEEFTAVASDPEEVPAKELTRRVRRQYAFYGMLYQVFQRDYLDSLRKFHPTKFFATDDRRLRVDDIVLLKPNSPFKEGSARKRLLWNRGRVLEVFPSPRDGVIRAAKILVTDVEGRETIYPSVPIQNLAPLECYNRPQTPVPPATKDTATVLRPRKRRRELSD